MSNALRSLLRRSLKDRGALVNRRLTGRPKFRFVRAALAGKALLWPVGAVKPDKVHQRHKRLVEAS